MAGLEAAALVDRDVDHHRAALHRLQHVAGHELGFARTSTFALNNATLPFAVKLANMGAEAAMKADPHHSSLSEVEGYGLALRLRSL
jgi:hypothetical protein